ncbi:hypothetical protein [Jiella avicenniae]|nr:hypothetical protein [Jiella avicenniae]
MGRSAAYHPETPLSGAQTLNSIIYLVGLVVVVIVILSLIGIV